MKKPTQADIFFIKVNPDGLSNVELAKATGLTNTQVNNLVKKFQEDKPNNPTKKADTNFQMASARKSQKGRSVFVMTPAASEIADAAREQNKSKDVSSFISKVR